MKKLTLALIGFRGVGKTTLGRYLAKSQSIPFHDSDELLLQRLSCSLHSFVEKFGLAEFRRQEALLISELIESEVHAAMPRVFALGGGFVDSPVICEILQSARRQERLRCVYLWAPEEFLVQRNLLLEAQGEQRVGPWTTKNELSKLYLKRAPHFEALADLRVESTLNPQEPKLLEKISEEILTWWSRDRRVACDQ